MKLVLVRHTSVAVPPGTCYGQSDVDVAATFAEEAAIVRSRLSEVAADCVYSSPLQRCMKLAKACGYDSPIVEPSLMELNFGEWEMKRWDEIADPRLQEYFADYEHVAATGGESFAEQRERVRACLDRIAAQVGNGTALIFTHGGVIAAAMMLALGLDVHEAFARQPRYGDVVTFP